MNDSPVMAAARMEPAVQTRIDRQRQLIDRLEKEDLRLAARSARHMLAALEAGVQGTSPHPDSKARRIEC